MGFFLAKPRLVSLFSGDRYPGEMYLKAITEPVYKYLKKLHEELVYYAGRIDRYNEKSTQKLPLKFKRCFEDTKCEKKQMMQRQHDSAIIFKKVDVV